MLIHLRFHSPSHARNKIVIISFDYSRKSSIVRYKPVRAGSKIDYQVQSNLGWFPNFEVPCTMALELLYAIRLSMDKYWSHSTTKQLLHSIEIFGTRLDIRATEIWRRAISFPLWWVFCANIQNIDKICY